MSLSQGTYKFSSDIFIQSGAEAQFKSGIEATGNSDINGLSTTGTITANNFIGIEEETPTTSLPTLTLTTTVNDVAVTSATTNDTVRIAASGDFQGYCFIKNDVNGEDNWVTVSKGGANGLNEKNFIDETYSTSGIYEYIIIANKRSTFQTVVKGITITITDNSQA